MSEPDAYAVCRYIRHYTTKNGYLPTRDELGVPSDFVDLLVKNGVIVVMPLHEDGPPIKAALTEKGVRMSERQNR